MSASYTARKPAPRPTSAYRLRGVRMRPRREIPGGSGTARGPLWGCFSSGFKPLKLFVPGGVGGWVIVVLVGWVPYKAAAVGGRRTYEALFGGCGGCTIIRRSSVVRNL